MHAHTPQLAPCTPAVPSAEVNLSWDRIPAAQHRVRAWARRLGRVESEGGAWGRYLRSVYGDALELPFDLRRLRWFWWWAPGAWSVTRLEMPVWRSIRPGDAWVPGMRMERHLAQAGFFLSQLSNSDGGNDGAASAGLASGSLAEVMRVSHPPGEDTSGPYGPEAAAPDQVWYWHAPGSGIRLGLGRTIVVPNRSALLGVLAADPSVHQLPFVIKRNRVPLERGLHLCEGCSAERWLDFEVIWSRPSPPTSTATGPTRLCDPVRRAGFDTVQIVAAFGGQRYEIVDCRDSGGAVGVQREASGPCPSPGSLAHLVRAVRPSRSHAVAAAGVGERSCKCEDERSFLNCGGCAVPAVVRRLAQPGAAEFVIRPPRHMRAGPAAAATSASAAGRGPRGAVPR